jgi:hypothetical protein
MKLVMVTTSHAHWDGLAGNTAMFSEAVVQAELLQALPESPVDAIFIKKDPNTRRFEKAWKGKAGSFKRISKQGRDYLSFKLDSLKPINCPESLRSKNVGCHILPEQRVAAQEAPKRPLAAPLPKLRMNGHSGNGKLKDDEAEAIVNNPLAEPDPETAIHSTVGAKEIIQQDHFEMIIEPELLQAEKMYVNGNGLHSQKEPAMEKQEDSINPAFFSDLLLDNSPALFEKHCYQLLKLLGIHDIHRPINHAGTEANGFFKFNTLAVVYTTTLVPAVVRENKMVVDHYLNLLKKEKIHFSNHYYSLKDTQKQVWVISRTNEQTGLLRTEDGIKLKAVSVQQLMTLFRERFSEESLNSDAIWQRLLNV